MDAPATELGPLNAIERAALTECFDLFDNIERALEGLPYRIAAEQLGNVGTIREHLANCFPGGLAGACEYCGEMIGYDEIGASDHENGGHACKACVAKDPAHFDPAPPVPEIDRLRDGIDRLLDADAVTAVEGAPPPSAEGDRLREESARLLEASGDAATTDDAIELRMDAARSAEAARRADAAATQKLFSPAEAARLLGVSRATIYNLRKAGGIKLGKLLGRTVIARSEIERLVAEASRSPLNQQQEAAAQP